MLVQRADALRAICRARWFGLLFAVFQIGLFYNEFPPGFRQAALALVAFYGVANLAIWSRSRRVSNLGEMSRLAVESLALDVLVVSTFVGIHLFDPSTPVRSLLYVLPLEGALLYQYRGAIAAMTAAGVLYAAAELVASVLFGHDFVFLSVTFRIAIGLVIATVAGGIASHLEAHRDRITRINSRLTNVLANLPGMAYRARGDEAWTLEFVSDGAAELTGYTAAEFLSPPQRSFETLIHPEDRARVREEAEAAISAGAPFQVEYRLVARDGTEKWVWEQGRGVPDPEHGGIALEGLIIDATDRKRLEGQLAQSQKMEAVGRLAGGIAHDFNNLLSVVTSYAVLVADDLPEGSPLREDLAEIHEAGKRGADLVRQLLSFSRNEVVAPQVVEVDLVVRDMMNLLRRAVGEDIQLETRLAADAAVLIDRGQLEQVLMNLVVNARDAMPQGGSIKIETRCGPPPTQAIECSDASVEDRWLTISVVDTGEGMSPEVLAHVLEPFFTTKQKGGGTGLGLATTYGIIDKAGGHIEIGSEVGKGTTVDVYLPPATTGAETSETEAPAGPRVTADAHTILVVEDEAPVRNVLERMLVKGGHEVCTAASGREALIYLEDNDVDLVITDVMMPGLSGHRLIEEMRDRGDRPEVIYISGYDKDVVAEKTHVEEDDLLIQKPFSADELLGAVSRKLAGPTGGS